MAKLICVRGFSASGKSTLAKKLAGEIGGVVVNRDYLRKMSLGEWWTGKSEDENRITLIEKAAVKSLLQSGVSTVVDATHLAPQFLRKWAKLAGQLNVGFEVIDVRTDVEECVLRDLRRMENGERYVGEKVIRDQAKRFPMEKWPKVVGREPLSVEPVKFDPELPDAVIFDIDGTLAQNLGGRSAFDYSRVNEDTPDDSVRWINQKISQYDPEFPVHIFIVSGRDDTCREATENWLHVNDIYYDELLMRDTVNDVEGGNKVADTKVKYRLYNEHIRGRYNVRMVWDDRNSVVDMWRRLGLKCSQVQLGDF